MRGNALLSLAPEMKQIIYRSWLVLLVSLLCAMGYAQDRAQKRDRGGFSLAARHAALAADSLRDTDSTRAGTRRINAYKLSEKLGEP